MSNADRERWDDLINSYFEELPGIREKGYVFTILHQRRIPEVV